MSNSKNTKPKCINPKTNKKKKKKKKIEGLRMTDVCRYVDLI